MAKNKKQDRKQPQSARGARQNETTTVMEPPAEPALVQAGPGDIARKGRQKRFGHN
ncbi:hypothetical protein [Streptomyces nigra]|uniref:hypothetical protein n=1 Tax=Streptomyces nigra TaxID=1827580 RepID=UPI0035E13499